VKMERIFGIIPASPAPYIVIWVISLILLAIIGMFIYVGYSSRHVNFTVNDQGLCIGPGFYGRFIPAEDIDKEGVKVVNLDVDSDYQPRWRTNGAGLPGYSAGWFKLANKEKALVFLTDRSRVVYIPTNKEYSVLLSVREAEELADVIKNLD
jgi:hypothetical protein